MIIEYLVEQINVSDDEYTLVEMCCESGDFVKKNQAHHIITVQSNHLHFHPLQMVNSIPIQLMSFHRKYL